MEIVRELEERPAAFTAAPSAGSGRGDFRLSVPIRSLFIDAAGKAWLDVGSGIVIDSGRAPSGLNATKSRFLTSLPRACA